MRFMSLRCPNRRTVLAAACAVLTVTPAAAELCPAWSEPETIGRLDVGLLPEASGIELGADGGTLYLMNDGTRGEFFVAGLDGSDPRRIRVSGYRPRDQEDLALGPCAAGSCVYLADIGDNARRRATVQIALVAAADQFPDEVPALHVVVAQLPDGPHDAEAVAVHPHTGELWLATKSPLGRADPVRIYRLTAAQLAASDPQTFEHIGDIPYAAMAVSGILPNLVTSMDFSPDGERLALLTYGGAVEFAVAADGTLPVFTEAVEGLTHRPLATALMIQAESIVYGDDGRTLIYTTESVRGSASPIARSTCSA